MLIKQAPRKARLKKKAYKTYKTKTDTLNCVERDYAAEKYSKCKGKLNPTENHISERKAVTITTGRMIELIS